MHRAAGAERVPNTCDLRTCEKLLNTALRSAVVQLQCRGGGVGVRKNGGEKEQINYDGINED